MLLVIIVVVTIFQRRFRLIEIEWDENTTFASDYAMFVRHIPKDILKTDSTQATIDLKDFFNKEAFKLDDDELNVHDLIPGTEDSIDAVECVCLIFDSDEIIEL